MIHALQAPPVRVAAFTATVPALAGALLLAGTLTLDVYWALVALLAGCLALPAIAAAMTSGQMLSLLVLSAVVAPTLPGGQYLSLGLALLACLMWGFDLIVRRGLLLHRDRSVVAVLAFMATAVLAFLVGQYPWFPVAPAPLRAQLGGLALFLASAGVFLVAGHQLRSIAHLKRLTWLFVVVGGLFVVQQLWASGPLALLNPVTQPDTVGSMFWTWFVAVTLSQAFLNTELRPAARTFLLLLGIVAIGRGVLLAFSWVSGWLPPLVAAGIVVAIRFPRLSLCTAALAVAPALMLGGSMTDSLMQEEAYSVATRLEAFKVMARLLESNPWLGYGPSNYYHYAQMFPLMGWWVQFNSHNNYLDIVAQTGIVGLGAFFWFAAEATATARRVRRLLPWGFPSAYAAGVLAGVSASLVAALLADWVVPFTYNIGVRGFRSSVLFWLFTGGVLALARIAAHQTSVVPIDVGDERSTLRSAASWLSWMSS